MMPKTTLLAFSAFGSRVQAAVEAAQKLAEQDLAVRVVNMRFVKPLDEKMIATLAPSTALFVTVEETCGDGGCGQCSQ